MEIEEPNNLEPDVKPDRSVWYFGLIMGLIVLVMAILTMFIDDIRQSFNKQTNTPVLLQKESGKPLKQSTEMTDEEVRASLTRFIEAFYVDQKKGYFDPPSYFDSQTETYYNFHNLTYQRLKQVHAARMADYRNLELNWLVPTLTFERRNDTLITTFWTRQSYFRPSKNTQEKADILMEWAFNKEGKIKSFKELEIRNLVSMPLSAPSTTTTAVVNLPIPASSVPEPKAKETIEQPIYNSGVLDFPPEFPGGNKKLIKYLNRNLNYPQAARRQQVGGRVFVSFVVEQNGMLNNVKVIRGIGYGCDEEAVRVLRNSPNWRPGMLDGKAVRTNYVLPILFQIAD